MLTTVADKHWHLRSVLTGPADLTGDWWLSCTELVTHIPGLPLVTTHSVMMVHKVTLGQGMLQTAFEAQTRSWLIHFPPVHHGSYQPSDSVPAARDAGTWSLLWAWEEEPHYRLQKCRCRTGFRGGWLGNSMGHQGPGISLSFFLSMLSCSECQILPSAALLLVMKWLLQFQPSHPDTAVCWGGRTLRGSSGVREPLSGAAQHTSSKDWDCQHLN